MPGNSFLQCKYHQILANCTLLQGLDTISYNSLLALFHEEKWKKNTCILNQEKCFNNFYIIFSGRVKMYQIEQQSRKEITLFLLTSSDVFDMFCLLDGYKHPVYYECLDNVRVLAAPMTDLKEWLNKNPQHYKNLFPYVGKLMRLMENYVSDITFRNIPTRLINLLIRNVREDSKDLDLINDLPNKEIANLIGSTRAVVNRHLQDLKKNGAIEVSRNRVEIKDHELLLRSLKIQRN